MKALPHCADVLGSGIPAVKLPVGRGCFVCTQYGESLTAIHPRTNLGRGFRCKINFNAIDLVMCIRACDFVTADHFLEPYFPPATLSDARS